MFERLTNRTKYGVAYTKIPLNESNVCDVGECYTGRIADRLAAYEDSGLSPAEVESLAAQLAEVTAERDAAVETLTKVLKNSGENECLYCKNLIECREKECDCYSCGVGDADGNYPGWKWECTDFDYGTCEKMINTPCNGCFENDSAGFVWRGVQKEAADNA